LLIQCERLQKFSNLRVKSRFDRRVVSTKGSISFQGRFDLCESHSAMESQNEANRGQCVDQKRLLYVGPKQTRTWESFWSVGPYWQLLGLTWKMMGPLRQWVGPIWLSAIPKMAPWVPIQISHRAKTALAPKGLKRNLGSFWPFLIYIVYISGIIQLALFRFFRLNQ
jgi:hypothetical protein